jgi:hypothetical protein
MTAVYISGPIKNDPDHYVSNFLGAEVLLSNLGYYAMNPVVIGDTLKRALGREPTYKEYMRADCEALLHCSEVALLPGWELSDGACFEKLLAEKTGITVKLVSEFIKLN